jgi:hypothetical protein
LKLFPVYPDAATAHLIGITQFPAPMTIPDGAPGFP